MTDPKVLRRIVAEGCTLHIKAHGEAVRCLPDKFEAEKAFYDWFWQNADVLLSALEDRALSSQQTRDEVAKGIDSRVKWLMREAHSGGNWDHLKARTDEAAYLAQWIRALKSAPPSEPTP